MLAKLKGVKPVAFFFLRTNILKANSFDAGTPKTPQKSTLIKSIPCFRLNTLKSAEVRKRT